MAYNILADVSIYGSVTTGGNLDLSGNELLNVVVQNLATGFQQFDPAMTGGQGQPDLLGQPVHGGLAVLLQNGKKTAGFPRSLFFTLMMTEETPSLQMRRYS